MSTISATRVPRVRSNSIPFFPKPMLARPAQRIGSDALYAYESKWDGIRLLTYVDRSRLELRTRNGIDVLRKYPELLALKSAVKNNALMLDGELVVLDENSIPRFHLLQKRLGLAGIPGAPNVTYIVFDVLFKNGESVMNQTYVKRRDILEKLNLNGQFWNTPGFITGSAMKILTQATALGMEGIVAKKLESPYLSGQRTDAWLKLKIRRRQELIICGWQPGNGSRSGLPGALLLGYYEPKVSDVSTRRLIYAGECGSGFTEESLRALQDGLEKHRVAANPFDLNVPKARNLVFARPRLVGEFEFSEWTQNGLLRHPVFLGVRTDRHPNDVIREEV